MQELIRTYQQSYRTRWCICKNHGTLPARGCFASFNYDTLIPALSLGLTAGYEYTIKGLPLGLNWRAANHRHTMEAGEFNATLFASNRFGDANVSFSIEVAPGSPSVLTLPAGNIASTTALLHADILDTGGEVADLSFIYGESADNLTSSAPRR